MKKKDESIEEAEFEALSGEEQRIIKATQKGKDRSKLPHYDNSDMAVAKRYIKKNKFFTAFVVITFAVLLALIGTFTVIFIKNIKNAPSKKDVRVTMGKEEFVLPYKSYFIDGVFYFDMMKLTNYAELTVSGGDGRLKFTCPDGTYVRFENGTDTATVNGDRVHLEGNASITANGKDGKDTCLIPFTFVKKLFSYKYVENSESIRIKFSDKDNTLLIRRITYKDTGLPLPISFSSDSFYPAEDVVRSANILSHPGLASACEKSLTLVNKTHPLGEDYIPEGLVLLNEIGCPTVKGRESEFEMDRNAAMSLKEMLTALNGTLDVQDKIYVTSAFRSFNYQSLLFENSVYNAMKEYGLDRDAAEKMVNRTSARPGKSEHQSGLCADLIKEGTTTLNKGFENTVAFGWLKNNAHKYGFILRYPDGKEDITGYDYEPWHYRFVGIDAATVIYEDGICLEEYLAILS